jgi:electron transfer flavoprotein-quinone oxidoreductase
MLLAGDAAGLCYTNGLTQEGMNLAMTSGLLAAQVGAAALADGDLSADRLAGYASELGRSFILRDMKTSQRAIDLMHVDRLFTEYPRVIGQLMEDLYRSDGTPREKIGRLGRRAAKGEVPLRRLVFDVLRGGRAFLW